MRMGNLLGERAVVTRMNDTHPGLYHVTVVPSNYDGDEEASADRRTGR